MGFININRFIPLIAWMCSSNFIVICLFAYETSCVQSWNFGSRVIRRKLVECLNDKEFILWVGWMAICPLDFDISAWIKFYKSTSWSGSWGSCHYVPTQRQTSELEIFGYIYCIPTKRCSFPSWPYVPKVEAVFKLLYKCSTIVFRFLFVDSET